MQESFILFVLQYSINDNSFFNIARKMAYTSKWLYDIHYQKNSKNDNNHKIKIQYIIKEFNYLQSLNLESKCNKYSYNEIKKLGEMITKYFSTFIMNKITFTLYCFSCISPVSNCYLGHKVPALCFFPKDYCRMLYWKYDEIPSDFVFRFSLNFWNLINLRHNSCNIVINI